MAQKVPIALLVVGLSAASIVGGCSAVQSVDDPIGSGEYSFIEIDCTPPEASLFVNERYMGDVHRWRGGVVPLKPGAYRVELQHDGYYPYQFDLTLKPGRMARLELDLIKQLTEVKPEASPETQPERIGRPSSKLPQPKP